MVLLMHQGKRIVFYFIDLKRTLVLQEYLSQCLTKEGLSYDAIFVRKEHYDVIVFHISILPKAAGVISKMKNKWCWYKI